MAGQPSSKMAARDSILAEWNEHKHQESFKIHETQHAKAVPICSAFFDGVSLVTLVASPQWGKTGVALDVIYTLTTHPDDDLVVHPDNVFIITGMSDKDWVAQTKARVLPRFKDRVFHRNDVPKLIEAMKGKQNVLVYNDECHFGALEQQTIHKSMRDAGLWDIDYLQSHNVKLLFVSATPVNVLVQANQWGPEHHQIIIASGLESPAYVGFHTLLEEKRILSLDLSDDDGPRRMFETITERWPEPRYHVVRLSVKKRRECHFRTAVEARGFVYINHDSKERMRQIDSLLDEKPEQHTFILIKGFWRASKTLNDRWLGCCYDMTTDHTSATQGLGGRLLGFTKQRGPQAPLLYSHIEPIQEYVDWMRHGCDYGQVKKLSTTNLKIRKGAILHLKNSLINPEGVANLTPVKGPLPVREKNKFEVKPGTLYPHKIEVLPEEAAQVYIDAGADADAGAGGTGTGPIPAFIATTFTRYTVTQFLDKFKLDAIPETAYKMSKEIQQRTRQGTRTSYTNSAASQVTNLLNYYTHSWAKERYHVLYLDGDSLAVIERDLEFLKIENRKAGDRVLTHNQHGRLVLYQFISKA